jgi:hypothetical protein
MLQLFKSLPLFCREHEHEQGSIIYCGKATFFCLKTHFSVLQANSNFYSLILLQVVVIKGEVEVDQEYHATCSLVYCMYINIKLPQRFSLVDLHKCIHRKS